MKDHRKPDPLCGSKVRECMKCRREFTSQGNGTCDDCQEKNRKLSTMNGKYVAGSRRLKSVEGDLR